MSYPQTSAYPQPQPQTAAYPQPQPQTAAYPQPQPQTVGYPQPQPQTVGYIPPQPQTVIGVPVPAPAPVPASWKPTANRLSDSAKAHMRKTGILEFIFALLGMIFAIVIMAVTGSVTNENTQVFILTYNIVLLVVSFVALVTSFGIFGKAQQDNANGAAQQNPPQADPAVPTPEQPGAEKEVKWNISIWKEEGLERFFAWIGLSLHNVSDGCGYCAMMHTVLSFLLELCATIYGGYLNPLQDSGAYAASTYFHDSYLGRGIPAACLVLSIIQMVLLCIQMTFASSYKPQGMTNYAADFGENLLCRADALGIFLSFEALIVALYSFSPNDLVPHGVWTNFSSYMYANENTEYEINLSTGNLEAGFQPTKIFFALGIAFGTLLQVTIICILCLGGILKFKGTVLRYLFKGVFFTLDLIIFFIFIAALIVQVVYVILAMATDNGLLRSAVFNSIVSDSALSCAVCDIAGGGYDAYCSTNCGVSRYLKIFFYIFTYAVPLVCAAYCIEQFFKLLKVAYRAVENYLDSFVDEKPDRLKVATPGQAAVVTAGAPLATPGAPQSYPAPGYPGAPGMYPQAGAPPPGGYPPQGYPAPGYPGAPGMYPQAGAPPPGGYPPQGYPAPGYPYPAAAPGMYPQPGALPASGAPPAGQELSPVKVPDGAV